MLTLETTSCGGWKNSLAFYGGAWRATHGKTLQTRLLRRWPTLLKADPKVPFSLEPGTKGLGAGGKPVCHRGTTGRQE